MNLGYILYFVIIFALLSQVPLGVWVVLILILVIKGILE